MDDCTIVIPCFNEASRLRGAAMLDYVGRDSRCQFLFVNDGSTDATRDVLESLAQSSERIAVLDLPQNRGKAEAVRRGVLEAARRGPKRIGYWDADLATPLEAIGDFQAVLDRSASVQMVLGSRVQLLGRAIRRRAVRHYLGRCFATAASMVLKLAVYDTQCGAKLFRATDEMLALFAEPFGSRWIFDVELLARLALSRRSRGQRSEDVLYELPLERWEDVAGSKVRPQHFVRAIMELAEIALRYRGTGPSKAATGEDVTPSRGPQNTPEKKAA
jgi:glycosyltransferase involved in cell wall biosynthesis